MTLREMMARHAAGPLTRTDHNGESVTLVVSDVETVMDAVVDRLDVEPTEGSARISRLAAMVFLPKSEMTAGYPVAGDEVKLAMRLGGSITTNRITRVVAQDEGGVLVEVQT